MAVTVKVQNHESGGRVELGQFTLTANAGVGIATDTQVADTVTVVGAKVGDLLIVQAEAPDGKLLVAGSKVTATDTITVYTTNDSAGSVTATNKTYNYMLVHLS